MSCFFLIGINTCFKELPLLPPGTKVKMREDLKEAVDLIHNLADEIEYKEAVEGANNGK